MNYSAIKPMDVANGPGIRVNLFVSGCTHHCKGCFNPETWDFRAGSPYTEETARSLLDAMAPDYIGGFTFLGGEPMEPANRPMVLELARELKKRYPGKTIWCYTGYLFDEDLLQWVADGDADLGELLSLLDVIVDGEFIEARKNLRLQFRGSDNQRLIDVPASLREKKIVLWEG